MNTPYTVDTTSSLPYVKFSKH